MDWHFACCQEYGSELEVIRYVCVYLPHRIVHQNELSCHMRISIQTY